ncbi:MAG TPA: hypothetical protein VNZ86_11770 [Bacteroidia bacterium]|nr:hypothetical protein [Bacteroidia bacterium]
MRIQKYIAPLFCLFLFLFPLTEKGIHDFSHRDDTHCTSDARHLHTQEHSCSICDYTLSSAATLPEVREGFQILIYNFLYSAFRNNNSVSERIFLFSPRGPPACFFV